MAFMMAKNMLLILCACSLEINCKKLFSILELGDLYPKDINIGGEGGGGEEGLGEGGGGD